MTHAIDARRSDQEEVLNGLLVETFNIILKVEQEALHIYKVQDLSVSGVHTIEAIGDGIGRSMSEIAVKLGVTVATVTVAVNRLVSKGYASRGSSDEDRRVVVASLTERGREIFDLHRKFHNDMVRYATKDLSDDERDILVRGLGKIKEFFERSAALGRMRRR